MQPRRQQKPITIRSDFAAERLSILTSNGRSQAQIIEEALARMPLPDISAGVRAERIARLRAITAVTSKRTPPIPNMAEFDAREYDERGNPR